MIFFLKCIHILFCPGAKGPNIGQNIYFSDLNQTYRVKRSLRALFRFAIIFLIDQYLIVLLASEIYVWQLLPNE